MSEELILRHGSPTLAGLKTGNLFSAPCHSEAALRQDLRHFNRLLSPKGLCMVPLRFGEGRALIYLYRPSRLRGDLAAPGVQNLLGSLGYCCQSPGRCISHLMHRLAAQGDFPHEIGLFLGYPLEDVQGFILHRAKHYKCVGCWKVYGDAQRAQSLFAKFKKCTDVYCRQWSRGFPLQRLAVAI